MRPRIASAPPSATGSATTCPVIVSDSFGRPWRFGIVDVAIGVSGLEPLDDLRGTPDADGRVMHSTVRAVADEIASAAELALGKTAAPPARARPRRRRSARGEGRIRDAAHARRDRPLPLTPAGAGGRVVAQCTTLRP